MSQGRGFGKEEDALAEVLLDGSTAVGALLIFALVAGTGLVLGSFRVRSIGLGIAGVPTTAGASTPPTK